MFGIKEGEIGNREERDKKLTEAKGEVNDRKIEELMVKTDKQESEL